MNFNKENFASFDEFMSLYDRKNKRFPNVLKDPQNNGTMTRRKREETPPNNDVGLTVVPYARSSKTVRRQNSVLQDIDDQVVDDTSFALITQESTKKFPWEAIGHARREKSGDNIKVECVETKPFPFGVFGRKVVAVRDSSPYSKNNTSSSNKICLADSSTICTNDLPHPSKLRKRKKSTNSRQKGFGMEVDAHLALLRRKHAEFNWVPKGPVSTASCSNQEEVLPETMLQKVPNNSPPLSRKHPFAARTPLLYNDSPPNSWLNEYELPNDSFPSSNSTIQDQIIPLENDPLHCEFEGYTSEDDFHLQNVTSFTNDIADHLLQPAVTGLDCWAVAAQESSKEE